MKIYIVTETHSIDYFGEEKSIMAVFLEEANAKKYLKNNCVDNRHFSHDIETFETLDKLSGL
jgi:hypothetical protein